MAAILSSLKAQGVAVYENSLDADAAIIWSVLWQGRMQPNQAVYNNYRQTRRPVIVVDVGTLIRGVTWKIAVNHINALGYYGHRENLDLDRPTKLGLQLQKKCNTSPGILIAAQHHRSFQLEGVDQYQWIEDTVKEIRQHLDCPVYIRPHPRSPLQQTRLPNNTILEFPKHIVDTYDTYDICYDYFAVINYNSGPGIQAAIAGASVVVDSTSLAAPVGMAIKQLGTPTEKNREQWFIEICHTEYTVDEIERGTWITRIQTAL
jgi:hypothetical protein